MDKSKGSTRAIMLSLFVVSQLMIISTVGDGGVAGADPGPNAIERGINFISPLEKFTYLIKLAWAHFRVPDSERIKEGGSNAGEFIRNVAVKSFEESEETAERIAKAAGDAVHEAAENVKKSVSDHVRQQNDL
ncbi:uncharacterized protein LOC122069297 [Macadamia integrifolia]|uniref:uncharacterized protein LOC122069297 n=1 Tax=Macadamia integrifolia TaxID=60698 RepID=UPI001C4F0AB7|nr:uncharacterized protein LOC122069297 [Macadamia integrifolia]